jgi:hypothetical protein
MYKIRAVPPTINPSAAVDGISMSGSIVFQPENNFTVTNISDGIATLSGGRLTGLLPPAGNTDATNKEYVDSFISVPTSWKISAKAATTVNITLAGKQSIDYVTLFTGDRVLVKNQTIGLENGIYVVDTVGPWVRAFDMAAGSSAAASAVFIQNGLVNQSVGFLCINSTGLDIVGTNVLGFIPFSGNSIIWGSGLQNISNTISVDSTVLRTSGNQSASGILSITNITQSTDVLTGCLTLSGGCGIARNLNVGGQGSLNSLNVTNSATANSFINGGLIISEGNITGATSVQSGILTDGIATITGGNVDGAGNITATGIIAGNLLSDGFTSISGGNIVADGDITSVSYLNGSLLINDSNITGIVSLSGNFASFTNTVQCATLTDGYATLNSGTLSNLFYPQNPGDATNKAYVDSLIQGLYWKEEANAATTADITLSGTQTIDGVVLVVGNRVLVKNQTNAVQNGIYVVAAGAWSRSADMATGSSASGSAVAINAGTINGGSGYTCNNLPGFGVVGSDQLTFIRFVTIETVLAGNGLTRVVNTLNVNVDNSTIEISGNNLRVKGLGITGTQIASGAVTDSKITGPIAISKLASNSITIANGSGISGGAAVQLGNSLTLSVDSTVLRTTGSQTKTTGTLAISDTTQSTTSTNGCLVLGGGLGVAKDINCAGSIYATGVTDGTASLFLGNLSGIGTLGCNTVNCSNTITTDTLTGTTVNSTNVVCTNLTTTNVTGITNLTIAGAMRAATLTDGTANLTGGILSGLVFVNGNLTSIGNITTTTGTVTGNIISGAIGNITSTITSLVTVGGTVLTEGKLSNLTTPTNGGDAANKAYVDGLIQGLYWKEEVNAATTADITLSGTQTIDTVALVSGNRVLVKNQINAVENGIYVVDTGLWSRSADMAAGSSASGSGVAINAGTVNGGSGYTCTNPPGSGVVGTDSLTFVRFVTIETILAGDGLTKVVNTLSVNVDNSTIEISSNNLRVKSLGITGAQIAAGAITDAKITGPIEISKLASNSITINTSSGITGGAAVQLGNSLTLSVDSTVLRTTGSQTKTTGTLSINDTTQSTTTTSGCLVLGGGLGVARNITCGSILSAIGITDGTAVMALGNLSSVGTIGCATINNSGVITTDTLTGTTVNSTSVSCTNLSATNLTGITNLTISGTMRAATLTDGTASMSGGVLTGLTSFSATNITASSNITSSTINTGSLTATGTVSGGVVNGTSGTITTLVSNQLTIGSSVLTSGRLTNLATPTGSGDATNKAYVDSLIQGLYWKEEANAATTANITLSGTQTIDGVVLVAGNRVLVKNQTNGVQNGIYVVAAGAWSRSTDMAVGTSASGAAVAINAGSVNGGSGFTCNNLPGAGVVGTNSLTFVRFVTIDTIQAGNGLTKVTNTLNVNVDNSTIEISSNNLRVKGLGITGAQIAAGAVTDAKITGPIAISKLASNSITIVNGSGIAGGAAVQLGNSLTLSVDSTVLRTTGSQTKTTGTLTISDTTESSASTTGCLVLAGGLGISKSIKCASTITGLGFSDGTALMAAGNLSNVKTIGCTSINNSNTITTNTLTATTVNSTSVTCTNLTATNLTGISNLNITGTMTAGTLTDGTASLSGGILTGLVSFSATNLSASSNVSGSTMNTGSLTATGTITGNVVNGTSGTITTLAATRLTVGSSVLTNGRLTNLAAPTSSGDAANKAYVDTKFQPNYSTSETSLGITWIDGKTVYQKVLPMGSLPGLGGTTTVNHGIVTPQTWIMVRMMCASGGTTYTTPDYGTEISANSSAVSFRARGSSWTGYTGVAILQYTKV